MSLSKIIFLDRDGTLIAEPHDFQIDSIEKFSVVPGAISSLVKLKDAGFRFVLVSNQDGLGSRKYPRAKYEVIQRLLLDILRSEGITFDDVLICPHWSKDRCACRKPALGLVKDYLADPGWDRARSCVIGDRVTDLELAKAMGVRGFRLGSWNKIARELLGQPRTGEVDRVTKETSIRAFVDLDGTGVSKISTGIGFFDHMLEQISKHGGFDLELKVRGDLHIDEHHTVEDVALALGQALSRALGDKAGVGRYGFFLPMDEASARVGLDLSGRPYFKFAGKFKREKVGGLPTELVPHFFRSLAEAMGATLHLTLEGENEHHMVESAFKAVGRSIRMAAARTGSAGIPSTKGVL
jgi:imidazoleglycerol-phosphate dehydratase/histidinol-phosphatase